MAEQEARCIKIAIDAGQNRSESHLLRQRGVAAHLLASCLISHQRDELRWVKCLDKGRNGGWTSRPPSIRLGNWLKEVLFFSSIVHMQPAHAVKAKQRGDAYGTSPHH